MLRSKLRSHVVVHILKVLGNCGISVAERDRSEAIRWLVRVWMRESNVVETSELVELLTETM